MPTDGPLTQEPYGLVRNGYGEAMVMNVFLDIGHVQNTPNITAEFQVIGNILEEVISGFPADGSKST